MRRQKGKKPVMVKSHGRKVKKAVRKNYMNRGAGGFSIENKYIIEGEPLNPKADELVIGLNGRMTFDNKAQAEKALSKIKKDPVAMQFRDFDIEKQVLIKTGNKTYRL